MRWYLCNCHTCLIGKYAVLKYGIPPEYDGQMVESELWVEPESQSTTVVGRKLKAFARDRDLAAYVVLDLIHGGL